jgi:phosphohistidine phosphatase
MRLLLIRHGIAAPLGGSIERDADRPLTRQGEERLRAVAAALVRIAPRPRAILTSPLLRARQTAESIAGEWKGLRPVVLPALATGEEAAIRHALASFDDEDCIVLVGHENWISQLTAHLLDGKSGESFRYRKGGVALLDLKPGSDGRATLLWFIPPRVFRRL